MTNPDPARITDEMWKLWTDRSNPKWQLSGIYAFKKGYHSSVIENIKNWPGNYSIQLSLDLVPKNRDKARAIDLTMSDSEMVIWTTRMKKSAEDGNDDRLAAVKEFYGTLDGKSVFGLKKNDKDGPWTHSSADSTHLWHGHTSIFTVYVDDWLMLSPILSVWSGESLKNWKSVDMTLPRKGDSGEDVVYWQYVHNMVRNTVSPPCPTLEIDGDYGPKMAAAVADFWTKIKTPGKFDGSFLPGWLAIKYQAAFVKVNTPPVLPPDPIDPAVLTALVNEWLNEHIPSKLNIAGEVLGKVSLL